MRISTPSQRAHKALSATAHPLPEHLVERSGRALRCLACQRRCLIHEDQSGFCRAMTHRDGWLYSTAYGVVAEANVTPIENKPVYHYRPGTRVLSLGGLGCNLLCPFCQNFEVAFRDARSGGGLDAPNLPPERAVALAVAEGCQGIAWTFNEPSISPVYNLDCLRLAREAGLYGVYVTNGLSTHQALDLIGPWLNVYRVDLKAAEDRFYRRLTGIDPVDEILAVAKRVKHEFSGHVEVVTNVMPDWNDADEHLRRLADRVAEELGADVPWHLTTYVPYAFLRDVPPTPPETLERAKRIGGEAGLRFVYTDNPRDPASANTWCPDCGALVIERIGAMMTMHGLDASGACGSCGADLGIIV